MNNDSGVSKDQQIQYVNISAVQVLNLITIVIKLFDRIGSTSLEVSVDLIKP